MKPLSAAALLLVPALVMPAAQPPTRTENRQEPLAMGGKLWLSQQDGKLDIQGWDRAEVAIVAEFHDGPFGARTTLEVTRVPEGLKVEVKRPGLFPHLFFGFHRSRPCDLTLKVPRKLYLDARTVDGAIRLEDLAGEVRVRAVDGNIRAERLQARIKGGTVDGDITLDQVAGGIDLHTVDGRITAQGLDGWGEGISLGTVDGSIHVRLGAAQGRLEARTSDGSIQVGNAAVLMEETRRNTFKGRIPGREQTISLKTVDGDIRID